MPYHTCRSGDTLAHDVITMQDPIDRERRELFVRIAIDDVATSGQPRRDSPRSATTTCETVDDDARGRAHWRGD